MEVVERIYILVGTPPQKGCEVFFEQDFGISEPPDWHIQLFCEQLTAGQLQWLSTSG